MTHHNLGVALGLALQVASLGGLHTTNSRAKKTAGDLGGHCDGGFVVAVAIVGGFRGWIVMTLKGWRFGSRKAVRSGSFSPVQSVRVLSASYDVALERCYWSMGTFEWELRRITWDVTSGGWECRG